VLGAGIGCSCANPFKWAIWHKYNMRYEVQRHASVTVQSIVLVGGEMVYERISVEDDA
jgi:hypothetical protein